VPNLAWIQGLPKAELHLHIEGSLEPELMFALAKRNKMALPYDNVEAVRNAYQFDNLQSFLDIYYAGASVLITEQDFFDLAWAYFQKAKTDGVIHCELFFDPQTHTARGIAFATFIDGFVKAQHKAQQELGISSSLIMCFLRHLSQEEAFATLELAKPYVNHLSAVGLDSSELGHPPEKFKEVFSACRELGLRCVAHAGEEAPAQYIWNALQYLEAERIDHGVTATNDPALMRLLARHQVPLTVCPLSNIKLKVFESMQQHNIKTMLEAGVCVTINADDPSYFGGYVADNYLACAQALNMSKQQLAQIARNSFEASFVDRTVRGEMISKLERYLAAG
jgi:adenine deaminase